MRLNEAVYAALTRSEDLPRRMLVGGLAVSQVLERLDPALQAELGGEESNPVLARRVALEELTYALDELVQEGRVRRKRARMKSALVDVYRRRWL